MDHIYWVTEKLAGRCGPVECEWDLEELYKEGFRTIVSLDKNVDAEQIKKRGFDHVPLYLPDVFLSTPQLKTQFLEAANVFVSLAASSTDPVLVHCYAGKDRTGAMLACFLVSQGKTAAQAIAEVRSQNPRAMTAPGYEEIVYTFAQMRAPLTISAGKKEANP